MTAKPSHHAQFFYAPLSSYAASTYPIVFKFDWQRTREQTQKAIRKDGCALVWPTPGRIYPPGSKVLPKSPTSFIKNSVLLREAKRRERRAVSHKPGLGPTKRGYK